MNSKTSPSATIKTGLRKLWPFGKRKAEESYEMTPVKRTKYTPRYAERDALLAVPSRPVRIPRRSQSMQSVKSAPGGYSYAGSASGALWLPDRPVGLNHGQMPYSDNPYGVYGGFAEQAGRAYSLGPGYHGGSRQGFQGMGEAVPVVPRVPSEYLDQNSRDARILQQQLAAMSMNDRSATASISHPQGLNGPIFSTQPPLALESMPGPLKLHLRGSRSMYTMPPTNVPELYGRSEAYERKVRNFHSQNFSRPNLQYTGKGKERRRDSGSDPGDSTTRGYGLPASPPPDLPLPMLPASPSPDAYWKDEGSGSMTSSVYDEVNQEQWRAISPLTERRRSQGSGKRNRAASSAVLPASPAEDSRSRVDGWVTSLQHMQLEDREPPSEFSEAPFPKEASSVGQTDTPEEDTPITMSMQGSSSGKAPSVNGSVARTTISEHPIAEKTDAGNAVAAKSGLDSGGAGKPDHKRDGKVYAEDALTPPTTKDHAARMGILHPDHPMGGWI